LPWIAEVDGFCRRRSLTVKPRAVAVRESRRRRVSYEGKQHKSQRTREERGLLRERRCVVAGHFVERYVTVQKGVGINILTRRAVQSR
jgi:hypothetical protein